MYSYNIKIIALNIQLNQAVISMESSCDESLYSVWCKVFVIKTSLKALRHQQLQLLLLFAIVIFIEQRLSIITRYDKFISLLHFKLFV